MTISNLEPGLQGRGEPKVACQRFDEAAPYVVLHFTFWEQRLAGMNAILCHIHSSSTQQKKGKCFTRSIGL